MSQNLEKLLEKLLVEQRRISLYTLTLERDRLFGALLQAGLALPLMVITEFSLAAGATTTIVSVVPPGTVWFMLGKAMWHTSLPWWLSYNLWMNQTAPAIPLWSVNRMAGNEETLDFKGVFPITAFMLHVVQNNHATEHAYAHAEHTFLAVSTTTWDMIKSVYLDPIVAEVREKALEIGGLTR